MFENFPKKRTELPEKYLAIYNEHYKSNREGNTSASSLSQKMERWLHRKVAADLLPGSELSTLEIGAGTLNQLLYEDTHPYDIIEPFRELYECSPLLHRVDAIYSDIRDVPLTAGYDRITSVATFEHISDLPYVVARTCLHLKPNGFLRVSIPNEGGWLWKLGWLCTTGIEFRLKYNLDYGLLMRHEHVNKASEIIELLNYFYGQVNCSYFGLGKFCALYVYIECSDPDINRATACIAEFQNQQNQESEKKI